MPLLATIERDWMVSETHIMIMFNRQVRYPATWIAVEPRRTILLNLSLLALLAILTIIITCVYISSEHVFYWWDYAGYQAVANAKTASFLASRTHALREVYGSFGNDYNELFTLPVVPFLALFGQTRLVYILSLAIVYLLPFALAVGAVATQLIQASKTAVFWSTALIALLMPIAWVPTLRGYPDTGGAFLIALAIYIYLRDQRLRGWWQILCIGCLLAAAMLFRRHFVYASVAFIISISIQAGLVCLAKVRRQPREALRELFWLGIRIALTVMVSLITLVVIARAFLANVLTNDFATLYSSYMLPVIGNLDFYTSVYGWVILVGAGLGLAIGFWTRLLVRQAVIFIALFASITMILWIALIRQIGFHYTLHLTPFVVLGIAALGWALWVRLHGRAGNLILSAASLCLACNFGIGLGAVEPRADSSFRSLLPASYGPLTRAKYDQVVDLVTHLHALAKNGAPIYVAASSSILNYDIVRNADLTVVDKANTLNFLAVPQIDSRDFYPLEMLLKSEYVLTTTPFAYHLPPSEQKVVKLVNDMFADGWEISKDFTRLPFESYLEGDLAVHIYQRTRPTSLETAVQTYDRLASAFPARPGGQVDWVSLSPNPDMRVEQKAGNTYGVRGDLSKQTAGQAGEALLYIGDLPARINLSGRFMFDTKQCPGVVLNLATIDKQSKVVNSVSASISPENQADFSLSLERGAGSYLVVSISEHRQTQSQADCLLTIDNLLLTPASNPSGVTR
jgi:hypothetical protein